MRKLRPNDVGTKNETMSIESDYSTILQIYMKSREVFKCVPTRFWGTISLEETSQTSHNMDVPFVSKTEYPLMNLNADTGAVSLLKDNGELKIDLNLPAAGAKNSEEDVKLQQDILRAFANDLLVSVVVIAACGMEKIISFSATD